jgi:uncharacterized protein
MKDLYEIKNISTAEFKGMIEDVDMTSRTVTGYFSRFGNVDSDNDILMPGAFNKTISERGFEGKNIIPHLLDHSAWETLKMLSKPKIFEKADGGFFESKISDTQNGNDVLKLYRDGVINQHSFGFKTIKAEKKNEGQREIKEVMIYEISTVVLGANSETPFTGFKSLDKSGMIEQWKTLNKCIESGDYQDWIFPLLEVQKKEIEKHLVPLLITTEPEPTQPDDVYKMLLLIKSKI